MKSSFSRSFSTIATILLLALTVLGASFQIQVDHFLEDTTVSQLTQDAEVLANLASAYGMEDNLTSRELMLNLDVVSQITNADVLICDNQGFIILCSGNLTSCDYDGWQINQEYLDKVYEGGGYSATGTVRNLYDEERYVVSTPILSGEERMGIVMVSTPTIGTKQVLTKISNIFVTAAVFVVLIAVMAVTAFTRRESKPLRELARTATAFGHGELDARVPIRKGYSQEVDELALAFNSMAASLQQSENQRREFVANVSHELKTPMTTIGGYVDGILDGTIPPEKSRHYMQIVSDETKRLSRLVRSMLDISQLQSEAGIPAEKRTRFDLSENIGQVLLTFEQKITAKNLNVEVDMPPHPVYTNANRDYITQVVYNLLDNAVKFCPENATVGIRLREARGKVYVSVYNDGKTIPAEELPLVFDRFHKLDKSRSENRDGWGLGLYIVKTIVCSHGENISVTSRDGRTEFTFTMPLVI